MQELRATSTGHSPTHVG